MKKTLLILSFLFGIAYGQTVLSIPAVITEPGTYTFSGEYYGAQSPVIVNCDCEVTIVNASLKGAGFQEFVGTAPRKFPVLYVLSSTFEVDLSAVKPLQMAPFAVNAGKLNTGGLTKAVIQYNTFINTAGVALPSGKAGYKAFVQYNYIEGLNGRIKDEAGRVLTLQEAGKLLGVAAGELNRHAITAGRRVPVDADSILIEWNLIDNKLLGPTQEDVISMAAGFPAKSVVFNKQGIATSSAGMVRNNLVRGNYDSHWTEKDYPQSGTGVIYDPKNQKAGNCLFAGNYAIGVSNTAFQHATYGRGFWDANVAVTSGYKNDTMIAYCSKGFGLYHKNPSLAYDSVHFTRNLSGYMNTRWGGRLDYGTWKAGGGEYSEAIYNMPAGLENRKIEGEITEALEQQYFDEYVAKLRKAVPNHPYFAGQNPGPDPVDPSEIDKLLAEIDRLNGEITELQKENAALQDANTALEMKIQKALEALK